MSGDVVLQSLFGQQDGLLQTVQAPNSCCAPPQNKPSDARSRPLPIDARELLRKMARSKMWHDSELSWRKEISDSIVLRTAQANTSLIFHPEALSWSDRLSANMPAPSRLGNAASSKKNATRLRQVRRFEHAMSNEVVQRVQTGTRKPWLLRFKKILVWLSGAATQVLPIQRRWLG